MSLPDWFYKPIINLEAVREIPVNKIDVYDDPMRKQRVVSIAVEWNADIDLIKAVLGGIDLEKYRPDLKSFSFNQILDEAIKRTDDGSKKD